MISELRDWWRWLWRGMCKSCPVKRCPGLMYVDSAPDPPVWRCDRCGHRGPAALEMIFFDGGRWVATGPDGKTILTSPDGVVWARYP